MNPDPLQKLLDKAGELGRCIAMMLVGSIAVILFIAIPGTVASVIWGGLIHGTAALLSALRHLL